MTEVLFARLDEIPGFTTVTVGMIDGGANASANTYLNGAGHWDSNINSLGYIRSGDHYEEVSTTDHSFTMRARVNPALAYSVPTFRSIKPNSPTAMDLWPSGPVPVEAAGGNGYTWFDSCDADLAVSELTPIRCGRLGITANAVTIGSVNFNGGAAIPLWFIVGSGLGAAVKASINTSGQFTVGLGADTPVFSASSIIVNTVAANPAISIRDSVNHSEWFATASNSIYMGSATNHNVVLRTNNVDRATFDTSGNLALAAGLFTGANIYAAGGSLKTVQTVDVTNRNTASATFAASGVITPSITPTSASNKILITASGLVGADAGAGVSFTLFRSINGGAYTDITPASTTELQGFVISGNTVSEALSFSFLDSPAATTAVLYQIYWKVNTSTARLGRRGLDTLFNSPTIITATEIKG